MKKNMMLLVAMMLVVTSILSACGNNGNGGKGNSGAANSGASENGSKDSGKSDEVTKIKFYNWDNEATTPKTQAMLDEFEAANPDIDVEHVVLVPGNSVEMLKKLDILISSGEAIDVIQFPSTDALLERAGRGAIAPLNEFYEQEGIKPEEEYLVNPMIEDKYYGIQYTTSYQLVLLNKDALDEAGLEVPKYGWTWDDYREYAKKMTKGEGVDKRYGTYFHTWQLYMNPLVQTVVKSPFLFEDGSINFSDPSYKYFFEMRKAMEKEDMSAKPYSDVLAAKLNYRTEFFNEEAAMIVSGSWMVPDPANTEQYPHEFKTAFAPIPLPGEGGVPTEYGDGKYYLGGNHMAIGASSKKKEASYKLMRYLSTVDSEHRSEFSGYKKADPEPILQRLTGNNEELYDMESLRHTLFSEEIGYLEPSKQLIPQASQLGKIESDGFSQFMLEDKSFEEIQEWMLKEANKVLEEAKK